MTIHYNSRVDQQDFFERFSKDRNIWIATVRPDGRPHLTPVWFVISEGKIYICVKGSSAKAGNLAANPKVACSLEDGSRPVICEGDAASVAAPWPDAVIAAFAEKYAWDLTTDPEYSVLVEIVPRKWLGWN